MSGGIIWYTKYSCPHCGVALSNNSIALIHFRRRCLICNEQLFIDADKAIPHTLESLCDDFVAFALYVILLWAAIEVTSIDVGAIMRDVPTWGMYLSIAAVALPGFALVKWISDRKRKRLIRSAREMVEEEKI